MRHLQEVREVEYRPGRPGWGIPQVKGALKKVKLKTKFHQIVH
jgi:hypothetical protein